MTYELRLPDIGEGVAEGEILKWMAKEGDMIKEDQPILEVMTDKVNVQIPAPRSGRIEKILVKEGDVAKVGQTIMVIDDGTGGASAPSAVPPAPASIAAAPAPATQPPGASQGVLATPATRRLAREMGVDISTVKGSGPQGRITDDDIRRSAPGARPGATTVTVQAPKPARPGEAQWRNWSRCAGSGRRYLRGC